MQSVRTVTAHHEAGHARAAARRGGTVLQIDISYVEFTMRGSTWADIDTPADEAFYAYAGSWAQARLRGPEECAYTDKVWSLLRENSDDWGVLQKAMGRHGLTQHDIGFAEIFGVEDRQYPPPGEVRPDKATVQQWHEDLAEEWPKIQDLAQQMLRGAYKITVGDDSPLVRINPSLWQRPDWTPTLL
jgi:hypothetical protein